MRFKVSLGLSVAAIFLITSVAFNPASSTVIAADANAYFDALTTGPGFWKGYSFRPKPGHGPESPYFTKQLEYRKDGGYQTSNSAPKYITYDSGMDAAKVAIPAWVQPNSTMVLGSGLGATDTKFYPSPWLSGAFSNPGAQFKIDGEIMVLTGVDPNTVSPRGVIVLRGQHGTQPAAHAAGSALYAANNSLPQMVTVPLDTADGNTYVFTWDTMYSSSFVGTGLAGNKTFQFTSGEDSVWWEIKTRMDGGAKGLSIPSGFSKDIHVGGLDVRSYNKLGGLANWLATDGSWLGPSVTGNEPVTPMQAQFILFPNRWIRYWVVVEQRENDYDYIDLWVADEVQNPIQIYKRIPASTLTKGGHSIKKFWIEFNDSQARLPQERIANPRDMVAYVRNFAALVNIRDVKPLLQRPVPGVLPGDLSMLPEAPKNVRIYRE